MLEINRGSAGGKARAIIQKQEAKQRIDEYNQNPNICKFCNKPLIAPYGKRLNETLKKQFCSLSCASKFNNKNKINNNNNNISIINQKSDEEIIKAFYDSSTISEFGYKLGYTYRIKKSKVLIDRLESLGLDINDIDGTRIRQVENLTKKEIFDKYDNWQTARSTIQKYAKINYENSNKPKKCIVCGYDKHYEVAHIKAVSDFDDNVLISDIDNIDNLIALCPNHHWEYDNTNFDIKSYLDNMI